MEKLQHVTEKIEASPWGSYIVNKRIYEQTQRNLDDNIICIKKKSPEQ